MTAETNRNAFRRVRTRTSFEARDLPSLRAVLVRIEAWRTVSPCLHPTRLSERLRDFLQARYGIGFSIPYRGCVRPTSATYCLSNRQPAFSVLVTCSGHPRGVAIHEMRSLTFHDVQARFGRIDASRRGLSPRDSVPACFEKAKYVSILASDTSVARSCFSRRPLRRATSLTSRPRLRATAIP